jgi:hypothetical protein
VDVVSSVSKIIKPAVNLKMIETLIPASEIRKCHSNVKKNQLTLFKNDCFFSPTYINCFVYLFVFGTTASIGPGPHHSRGF